MCMTASTVDMMCGQRVACNLVWSQRAPEKSVKTNMNVRIAFGS
jgi:hypothetical protein